MEALREGIGLRGYGQKDPKQEYKKEGFVIFGEMMDNIGRNVCEKLFHMQLAARASRPRQPPRAPQPRRRQPQRPAPQDERVAAAARAAQARGAGGDGGGGGAARPSPVRRSEPKVGRNDPCPCGSGKKYKKCHGARRHDVTVGRRRASVPRARRPGVRLGQPACRRRRLSADDVQVHAGRGTPLTLLADARLDRSATATSCSAATATHGALGGGRRATGRSARRAARRCPPATAGAWFAVAGRRRRPATRCSSVTSAPTSQRQRRAGRHRVVAAPTARRRPRPPPARCVTVPDAASPAALVGGDGLVAAHGHERRARLGRRRGQRQVHRSLTVDGRGRRPVAAGRRRPARPAPAFSCLAFSPGKDDLTVVYFAATTSTSDPTPGLDHRRGETTAGSVDSSRTVLGIGRPATRVRRWSPPTAGGYAHRLAGHRGRQLAGERLRQRRATISTLLPVRVGRRTSAAPNLQPPLVGLAPFGDDFGGRAGRVRATSSSGGSTRWGTAGPGPLIFPSSALGQIGASLAGLARWRAGGDLRRLHAARPRDRRPALLRRRQPVSDAARLCRALAWNKLRARRGFRADG